MVRILKLIAAIALLAVSLEAAAIVRVFPSRPTACPDEAVDCQDFDAVVFIHGIYGSGNTFRNLDTGFNWPIEFPKEIDFRKIDVFQVVYDTELLAWSKGKNPSFEGLSLQVMQSLKPLRKRQYRSIGIVAHSLGGNVASTYLHLVKSRLGHARRSQHAYLITLATPVLGSTFADIGATLKSTLGMSDPLLKSLKGNNLYLET